jgi:hypothetical protein
MSDIFISYASPDRDKARALAGVLDAKGWSVWWDRTIPPGKEFDEVIETALDSAKCVVVLWSKSSITSSWVKTEAADAMRRKVLVPALIDQVKIPLEFRRLQAADLSRWQDSGSQQDVATRQQLETLFQSISTLVAPDGATPTLPTPGAGERREREKLERAISARVTGPQGEPGVGKRKFTTIAFAVAGVIAVVATLALYKAHVDRIALQQAAKEQAVREQAAKEQAVREQAAREQAAKVQAAKEQAVREQAAREQAAKVQAAKEQAAREQAPAGMTGKCNDGSYSRAPNRNGGACAGHGGVKDWYGDVAAAAPATTEQAGAAQPKSKMAICYEKTKGMSKADADKARAECMKS